MKRLISHCFYPMLLLITVVSCNNSEQVPSYQWETVEVGADVGHSEEMEAIITPYRNQLDSMMNETIGYATCDLTTEGKYESVLGTFVCQLMLHQSRLQYDFSVDAVLVNHEGGLRAPIGQGPIMLREIYEVMPFENDVVLLGIPGDRLIQLIKHIGKTGHCMVYPVTYAVYMNRVESIMISGRPIVENQVYNLAISDYLANGGDGLHMLTDVNKLEVTPVKVRDMIVDEINQISKNGDSVKCSLGYSVKIMEQ